MQYMETKKIRNLNIYNLLAIILGVVVGFVCNGAEHSIFGVDQIRTVGDIVVKFLSWLAVPLVFFSVIHIVSQARNAKRYGKTALKVFAYFIVTSIIACLIGIFVALLFKHLGLFGKLSLISSDYIDITPQLHFMMGVSNITFADLVDAILKENFVSIAIFSLLVGVALAKAGSDGEVVGKFVESMGFVIEKLTEILVYVAPIGVFAMTAKLVFDYGTVLVGQVFWFGVALFIAYLLHVLLVFLPAVKFMGKMSIVKFFNCIFPVLAFAASSTSSLACIPLSEKACDSFGARESVTGLVIPAGYISNMDGTVLYLALSTIFLATGVGVSIPFGKLLLMTLAIILTEFGAAGVPHAGLIMLSMIMKVMGLDVNLIMILFALDIFFDMGRTCLNVTADLVAVACTEAWCKKSEDLS